MKFPIQTITIQVMKIGDINLMFSVRSKKNEFSISFKWSLMNKEDDEDRISYFKNYAYIKTLLENSPNCKLKITYQIKNNKIVLKGPFQLIDFNEDFDFDNFFFKPEQRSDKQLLLIFLQNISEFNIFNQTRIKESVDLKEISVPVIAKSKTGTEKVYSTNFTNFEIKILKWEEII